MKDLIIMMIKNDFYDEAETEIIYEYLKECHFEDSIKKLLIEFLQTTEMQKIILDRPYIQNARKKRNNLKLALINRFIKIFRQYIFKQEDLTWQNYCRIMHEIHLWKKRGDLYGPLKLMIRDLFFFLDISNSITNSKVKSFISKHKSLFLPEEFKSIISEVVNSDYTKNSIRTNFLIN